MKKTFLSSLIVISFVIYTLIQKRSMMNASGGVIADNGKLNTFGSGSTGESSNTGTNVIYKDGTYSGDSVDAFYGNVQIQTEIKDGKINNVQFLDYPKDRHTSIEINSQAMPLLSSEAVKNQSASVDIVSGATATSQAFIQSLQSALIQAKK
jgi:uncharacterized protein with FMN-binding domain